MEEPFLVVAPCARHKGPARRCSRRALRELAGYGIYTRADTLEAVIAYSPHAALWVADERWHPRQRWLADRSLELTLPYSNARELLMDVQRHGSDAEILAPPELREQMRAMLVAALGRYAVGGNGEGDGWTSTSAKTSDRAASPSTT